VKKKKKNKIKKDLPNQMKMFEEGGLKEEGGMVDDVSGNDVPIGSTREEVRDDIPAQLSEGEFVFPADVVRFIGLEKLMEMRQEAKAGLKRMEEMGQMGNSEEATLPDDMPFSMEDLDIEEQENEEEGEVTDSNFNRGGIVSMAEGGTIPTTENTDLNKKIEDKQKPIPQQRTTIQQQPLNVRQQQVPIRGMVTNIPKAEDFLKRKPTETKATPSFLQTTPNIAGSRFTNILEASKKGLEEKRKSINDVKTELDAILSDVPDGSETDTGDYSGPTYSTSLDYSTVDRMGLSDDLRGVFNDFSKAQLSMFSVVTASPFTAIASGIGTSLASKTGGKTAFGPINTAELGKMQAKAFHQVALDITDKYGVKSINDLSAAGQKELATQGRVHMDFAKDIYNASIGKPYSSFSFNEKDKKGFVDKAKDIVNAVMSIGKTQATMPSPEIAAKQKGMANLMTSIKDIASKSLETKQNKSMLDTVKEAVAASKAPTTTVAVDKLGNIDKANAHGFNAYGTGIADRQGTVTGVSKTGVISYSPKHDWGKPTQTRVTDKDVANAKGISTETFGGDTGDPGDGGGPTGDPDDDSSATTDVTSSSVAGPGNVSMSTDPDVNNDSDGGDSGGGGGGGSHICTATYNTGYIEKDHFRTLKKYGVVLRKTDPYMMKAYDVFGPKVASLVHTNKYVTSLAKFLTEYYKNVMLKKPLSVKQKMFKVLSVGLLRPLWRLIGRFM
jgi:hypothetical protein